MRRSLNTCQFYRTKRCPQHMKGLCTNGRSCRYAHSEADLRSLPDLRKTRLCDLFERNQCTAGDHCAFAHGISDLRATDGYYKTSFCRMWTQGECRDGDLCRYAHGAHELRIPMGRACGTTEPTLMKKRNGNNLKEPIVCYRLRQTTREDDQGEDPKTISVTTSETASAIATPCGTSEDCSSTPSLEQHWASTEASEVSPVVESSPVSQKSVGSRRPQTESSPIQPVDVASSTPGDVSIAQRTIDGPLPTASSVTEESSTCGTELSDDSFDLVFPLHTQGSKESGDNPKPTQMTNYPVCTAMQGPSCSSVRVLTPLPPSCVSPPPTPCWIPPPVRSIHHDLNLHFSPPQNRIPPPPPSSYPPVPSASPPAKAAAHPLVSYMLCPPAPILYPSQTAPVALFSTMIQWPTQFATAVVPHPPPTVDSQLDRLHTKGGAKAGLLVNYKD